MASHVLQINTYRLTRALSSSSRRFSVALKLHCSPDMLPLKFVEGECFQELMEFIEPEFKQPSRRTATSRVERMYEVCCLA